MTADDLCAGIELCPECGAAKYKGLACPRRFASAHEAVEMLPEEQPDSRDVLALLARLWFRQQTVAEWIFEEWFECHGGEWRIAAADLQDALDRLKGDDR